MLTRICNANETLCAACADTVTIILPDWPPPYTAGDELTCSSDGYPAATYTWTVGGVAGSTTSTQALQEGVHDYECTATTTFDDGTTCGAVSSNPLTETAYSKYRKRYNTLLTILLLTALSVGQLSY